MTELEILFEHAREFAVDTFATRGEVAQMWIADCKNGERMVLPGPSVDKDTLRVLVRALFKLYEVERYAMITEAWQLDVRNEADIAPAVAWGNSLKDHPDRREILQVQAEDKHETLFGHCFILRPEHGPPTLSEFHGPRGRGRFEGRMVGLLRP